MAAGGNLGLEANRMYSFNFSQINDLLQCSVCLLAYDDDQHVPKILSCHHTVCISCLRAMRAMAQAQNGGNAQFMARKCPQCRSQISLGPPEKLPTNFYIQKLRSATAETAPGNLPVPVANIPSSPCEKHSTLSKVCWCEECKRLECGICLYETHAQRHAILSVNDKLERISRKISDNKVELDSLSVQESAYWKTYKDFVDECKDYVNSMERRMSTSQLRSGNVIQFLKRKATSTEQSIGGSQERITNTSNEVEIVASKISELSEIFGESGVQKIKDKRDEILNLLDHLYEELGEIKEKTNEITQSMKKDPPNNGN